MTTFGLVHGAWHGGWCWDLLAAELERRGATAVAMDLPCTDPTAGIAAYAEVVEASIATLDPRDVVLVGHSLGALTVSAVAARHAVREVVYLAGLPPTPGMSVLARSGAADTELGHDAVVTMDPDVARDLFFPDCPDELARWATDRLRPQAMRPMMEFAPEATVARGVATRFVLATDDRVIPPERIRAAAVEHGATVTELAGSHSPFLARPGELAAVLLA
jgi:pimeloyl-ACP methyl ester carboxylesterase